MEPEKIVNSPAPSSESMLHNRIREMDDQVGVLTTLTTLTLLLALLMVILYILEMICGTPNKPKTPPTPLPTAVVIQPKGEDEKKKDQKDKEEPRDDCQHNSNRHFPSKRIMLELDVKRPDKQKAEKEKEVKAVPPVISMPIGAPPPYAESKKDAVIMPASIGQQPPTSLLPGTAATTTATETAATTASMPAAAPRTVTPGLSSTQEATTKPPGVATPPSAQPPPLLQLRATAASPRRISGMMQPSTGSEPSLPVPAKPPQTGAGRFATSPKRARTPRKEWGAQQQGQPGSALFGGMSFSKSPSTGPAGGQPEQITLLVITLLMVYWIVLLCYRTFKVDHNEVDQISPPTSVKVENDSDYLGEDDGTDTTPLDWKIERPAHIRSERSRPSLKRVEPILSDRDVDKTIRISKAAKGEPKRTRGDSEDLAQSSPVLNVIWEPTKGEYTKKISPGISKAPTLHRRQLISSTPIILKKPALSRHGYIDEPVILNLYYESSSPEEYVQMSEKYVQIPEANTAISDNLKRAPIETISTAAVISSEILRCVSIATTTKTYTRVSEPKPGSIKKAVDIHSTTKEVRKTPIGTPKHSMKDETRTIPVKSKSTKEAVRPKEVKATPTIHIKEKIPPYAPAASNEELGNVLAISSETRGEKIQEKTPSLRSAHDTKNTEPIPQVYRGSSSEKIILMTPDPTQSDISSASLPTLSATPTTTLGSEFTTTTNKQPSRMSNDQKSPYLIEKPSAQKLQ